MEGQQRGSRAFAGAVSRSHVQAKRVKTMERSSEARRVSLMSATRQDIGRLFGECDDETVVEVLALRPTVIELEEAAAWHVGQGDLLAREGRPQNSKIAAILELLQDDETDERRDARRT